jgi:hypothetical protein
VPKTTVDGETVIPPAVPKPLRVTASLPSGESSVTTSDPEGFPEDVGLNPRKSAQLFPGARVEQVSVDTKLLGVEMFLTSSGVAKSAEFVRVMVCDALVVFDSWLPRSDSMAQLRRLPRRWSEL